VAGISGTQGGAKAPGDPVPAVRSRASSAWAPSAFAGFVDESEGTGLIGFLDLFQRAVSFSFFCSRGTPVCSN